jgi:hypothetical protein
MFRRMINLLRTRPLTRGRIALAFGVAIVSDAAQFASGPLGWAFFDQAVDVIAMVLTSLLLGFHPLLLPTFVVELVPGLTMLPTWTGCVAAVVVLRTRPTATPAPPNLSEHDSNKKSPEPSGPVIDV